MLCRLLASQNNLAVNITVMVSPTQRSATRVSTQPLYTLFDRLKRVMENPANCDKYEFYTISSRLHSEMWKCPFLPREEDQWCASVSDLQLQACSSILQGVAEQTYPFVRFLFEFSMTNDATKLTHTEKAWLSVDSCDTVKILYRYH